MKRAHETLRVISDAEKHRHGFNTDDVGTCHRLKLQRGVNPARRDLCHSARSIENLWSFFQDAVATHEPKTLDEFEVLLDKVWWEIPQDHIRNLYHSMPTRLRTVLAADGLMTKY